VPLHTLGCRRRGGLVHRCEQCCRVRRVSPELLERRMIGANAKVAPARPAGHGSTASLLDWQARLCTIQGLEPILPLREEAGSDMVAWPELRHAFARRFDHALGAPSEAAPITPTGRPRRKISATARKKMAAGQGKRWALAKGEAAPEAPPAPSTRPPSRPLERG
jgi:hypothetical protein